MDLEKAYDTIYRRVMWQILRMNRVGGNFLKACRVSMLSVGRLWTVWLGVVFC